MTAPHVLLLHGALGASIQFLPLEARLGDRFRVHTLDFEGHGTSPVRTRPFRIGHFAENVVELLDRERLEHVHLFGYSMGGYVALHLAATLPDRIASVSTLATKLQWDPETAARESRLLDVARIRQRVPHFAAALAERHPRGWESVLARTAEMLQDLGERPLLGEEALGRITAPVRLGVGDRDATVSLAESVAAYRGLAKGELEVFPRTAHPWETVSSDRVARSIEEFVGAAGK